MVKDTKQQQIAGQFHDWKRDFFQKTPEYEMI